MRSLQRSRASVLLSIALPLAVAGCLLPGIAGCAGILGDPLGPGMATTVSTTTHARLSDFSTSTVKTDSATALTSVIPLAGGPSGVTGVRFCTRDSLHSELQGNLTVHTAEKDGFLTAVVTNDSGVWLGSAFNIDLNDPNSLVRQPNGSEATARDDVGGPFDGVLEVTLLTGEAPPESDALAYRAWTCYVERPDSGALSTTILRTTAGEIPAVIRNQVGGGSAVILYEKGVLADAASSRPAYTRRSVQMITRWSVRWANYYKSEIDQELAGSSQALPADAQVYVHVHDTTGLYGRMQRFIEVFSEDDSEPRAVRQLRAVIEGDAVRLTWDSPTDVGEATEYEVLRSRRPTASPSAGVLQEPLATIPLGTTTYVDSAVAPGSTYYYTVRCIEDYGGAGPGSNEVTVALPGFLCGPIVLGCRLGDDREICRLAADGGAVVNVSNHWASDTEPAWSPDGSRVAFISTRDGTPGVYTMGADGADVVRVTGAPYRDSSPAWSPDGRKIVFSREAASPGQWDLYVVPAEGGEPVRLTQASGVETKPKWSPDGQTIAYQAGHVFGYGEGVWTVPAAGGAPKRLRNGTGVGGPDWSPDGDLIVFHERIDKSRTDIQVMSPDGDGVTQVVESWGGRDPSWASDGQHIIFRTNLDLWVCSTQADESGPTKLQFGPPESSLRAWAEGVDWRPTMDWPGDSCAQASGTP